MELGSKITMTIPVDGNKNLCLILKKIGKYYQDYQLGYSETAYNAWRDCIDAAAAIMGLDAEFSKYDVKWEVEYVGDKLVLTITPIWQQWVLWRGVKE